MEQSLAEAVEDTHALTALRGYFATGNMFGRFLDWFDRHKYGVVGTLLLHTLMLFAMAMSKLPGEEPTKATPEMVMELAEPADMPPDASLQPPLLASVPVKNLASNSTAATASRPQMWPGRSAQEHIENNVEEDLKEFEAAEFARLAEERKAAGKEVTMPQLDPSKWNKERYMKTEPQPMKVEGLTTVSYDLQGRTDIDLDVPAYLCQGQGRVVVQVAVDRSGTVSRAELDAARTQADACMIEHALTSARTARFNMSSSAPDPQRGNITYTFLAQ